MGSCTNEGLGTSISVAPSLVMSLMGRSYKPENDNEPFVANDFNAIFFGTLVANETP